MAIEKHIPTSNPWFIDVGRLVVPNVFLEVDIIRVLAKIFEPVTKTIKRLDGPVLVDIKPLVIVEYYDLNRKALATIDLDKIEE